MKLQSSTADDALVHMMLACLSGTLQTNDIPKTTVHRIIHNFEQDNVTKAWPRSGRPQALDNRDKRHLVQIIEKDHSMILNQITAQIQDIMQESISASTI